MTLFGKVATPCLAEISKHITSSASGVASPVLTTSIAAGSASDCFAVYRISCVSAIRLCCGQPQQCTSRAENFLHCHSPQRLSCWLLAQPRTIVGLLRRMKPTPTHRLRANCRHTLSRKYQHGWGLEFPVDPLRLWQVPEIPMRLGKKKTQSEPWAKDSYGNCISDFASNHSGFIALSCQILASGTVFH